MSAAKAPRPRSVFVAKRPGVDVVFSSGLSPTDAALLVAKLAAVNCPARSAVARPDDVPGLVRRDRSADALMAREFAQ